jgi:hypothetical protein
MKPIYVFQGTLFGTAIAAAVALGYIRQQPGAERVSIEPTAERLALMPTDGRLPVVSAPNSLTASEPVAKQPGLEPMMDVAITVPENSDCFPAPPVTATDYDPTGLHAALLRQLPPAPPGVTFGSEEHIKLVRSERREKYLKTSTAAPVGYQALTDTNNGKSEAAPARNPYTSLAENGGVLSLIPPDVGEGAESETELLEAYRQEKVQRYDQTAVRR